MTITRATRLRELRFSSGVLQGDTNGDRRADFEIRVIDSAIGVGDLIL